MTPTTNNKVTSEATTRDSLATRMEPTAQAGAAAHGANLRQAIDGVRWDRRGLLGRLTRSDP
jgi:hypothetical protein